MRNVLSSQLEEYKRTNSRKSLNKIKSSLDTLKETYGETMTSQASSATDGSSNVINSAMESAYTAIGRSTRNKAEICESVKNVIANML